MTEKNIESAFSGARFVPLRPERVVSKLDVQQGTPTPPEEEAKPLASWVSKTPKTMLEAQSQSDYLEKQVVRHKDSSPESILEAIKSSSNGTKRDMQKVALVETRVKDLEQANEMPSRRRKAERTRLPRRSSIAVDEENQATDRVDVDAQVVSWLNHREVVV